MGIAAFGRGQAEGEGARAQTAPGPDDKGNAEGLTAFIGEGSDFQGSLTFKDTARIDGRFSGEIAADNTLVVGETADVEANIQAKNVIISGAVAGDVTASRQLILKKSGRLKGNVQTPSLIVEQGALFNGKTKMVRPEVLARAEAEAKDAKDAKDAKAEAKSAAGADKVARGQSKGREPEPSPRAWSSTPVRGGPSA
ncbi:MAG: polymer-forming cytoskeletal protein [Deltaproteobacteria bacterium]|nr:MAG: polymer-forming cytoskeletal protein [Deltaproteobacteria bacterium]